MRIFYKYFTCCHQIYIILIVAIGFPIHTISAQGTCASSTAVKTLPYQSPDLSNCGNGANYSDVPLCLENKYFGGEDYVFTYTPATDECIDVSVGFINKKSGVSIFAGLAVLDDCPSNLGAVCYETSRKVVSTTYDGSLFIRNLGLKANKTYYILVSGGESSENGYGCFDFKIHISKCSQPVISKPRPVKPETAPESIQQMRADCGNNLGFENGDLSSWEGCHYDDIGAACVGTPICTIKCDKPGLVTGNTNAPLGDCDTKFPNGNTPRHTIMTGNGTDPNTDNLVSFVAPAGGKYSVRLGNHEAGWQAECMWQTFTVTKQNSLFTYMYAVVLEDPINDNTGKHEDSERPRFEVTITDKDGKSPKCGGKYDVISKNASLNGFKQASNPLCISDKSNTVIYYKPWTSVATDLTQYIGQQITIKFCTADCGIGGHFGYAYVDTYCSPLILSGFSLCTTSGSATLVAPPGFKSYTWFSGPDTTGSKAGTGQKLTINNPIDKSIYTVKMELISSPGCFVTISDTISILTASAAGDTTICRGEIAPIQLKSEASDAAAMFSWTSSPPGFTSSQKNPSVPPPQQTTVYTVTVKTPGCELTKTVKVTVKPCDLAVSVTPVNVCEGGCDTLRAKAIAGTPPFIYQWSGGLPNTAGPHVLCPTTSTNYTVTVSDGAGLTASAVAKVTVNPIPTITVNAATICAGQSANLNAGGADIYKWAPPTGLNSTTGSSVVANPLTTTSYTVTGTTHAGCSNTATTSVTVNPVPILTSTSGTVCSGGTVTLTVDGAGAYTWAPATGLNSTSGASVVSSATSTTIYTVIGTSSNGCTSSITAQMTVNPVPKADFNVKGVCLGFITQFKDSSTIVSGKITSWEWSFGDDGTSKEQNPTHQYAALGTYTVSLIVISDKGCTSTVTKPITVYPVPTVNFGPFAKGCRPVCVDFWDSSKVASGSAINQWLWNLGDGNISKDPKPKHCYEKPGTYNVTLTVTTDKGCTQNKAIDKLVTVYPFPTADFSISPQPTTIFNPKISFYDLSSGNPISWNWTFWDHMKDSVVKFNVQNPPLYTYTDTGTYKVQLTVTNSFGCPDVITKYVVIRPEWAFYIPNTFTPNGDGKNDLFIGKSWNVTEHQMWIFDRWGNMVYTTGKTYDTESAVPWNGRANNGEDVAQIDTYVWLVILKDVFGNKHKYIGHVNLIR